MDRTTSFWVTPFSHQLSRVCLMPAMAKEHMHTTISTASYVIYSLIRLLDPTELSKYALERRASLHKVSTGPPLLALRPGDRGVPFKEVTLTPFLSQQQDLSASCLLCGEQLGPGLFSRSLQLVIPVYIPLTLRLCLCHIWQDAPIPPQCLCVLQVTRYLIPS